MSPPTRQFDRLSIGQNMPDDRAQASRTARDAGRPVPSDDGDGDEEEEEDSSAAESSSEGGEGEEGSEGAEKEGENSSDDDEENDSNDSNDGDDNESTSTSTVRAQSGITYDLRHLDTESEARALVGLTGQFEVVNCRTSDSGYDFQLLDRPRVHIGSDSPRCTCSTFQRRPEVACHHIFVCVPRNLFCV